MEKFSRFPSFARRLSNRFGNLLKHFLSFLMKPIFFVLQPIFWLLRPFKPLFVFGIHLLVFLWGIVGRMGLVLRQLMRWLVWEPLEFITRPLRSFYRATIHHFILWLGGRIKRFLFFLWSISFGKLITAGKFGWQWSYPYRYRWRRRWHSKRIIWRATWQLRWQRPAVPTSIPQVNSKPTTISRFQLMRVVAVLIALNVVLVGLALANQQKPNLALLPLATVPVTNTPTPAMTPQPTLIPTPTIDPIPWPTPDLLQDNGSVVFTMRHAGNQDIFAISVGQQEPVRLTSHIAEDRDPVWSPDGSQVAFASHRTGNWDIFILNLRNGELRRITDYAGFDGSPSWSPDGLWLVYESYRENNLDIFIVNTEGGQPIRLTNDPAPDYAPAWSPAGRHVAFTSWRTGNADIFVLNLDTLTTQTPINLTQSPDKQEDHAVWQPDGQGLAYDESGSGVDLIVRLPLQNDLPADTPTVLGQGKYPAWSPTGQSMVYQHTADGQSYLLAGGVDSWRTTTQAFAGNGTANDPDWTGASLPRNLVSRLTHVEQTLSSKPLYEENIAPQTEGASGYSLQRIPVRAPSPYLSDLVNDSFVALRDFVAIQAGWDFLGRLDNLFEPPTAAPLLGQNTRTWNKAGRAFDLDPRSVLDLDSPVEVVREDRQGTVYWRVYVRTTQQDGSQGEPLRQLPWDFRARYGQDARYYDEGGKYKESIPAGYYVDFTAIAAMYGWERLPADTAWRTFYPGIRFWHFEKRENLTWEQAMQQLYTLSELEEILAP